jgi:hypothetical protein
MSSSTRRWAVDGLRSLACTGNEIDQRNQIAVDRALTLDDCRPYPAGEEFGSSATVIDRLRRIEFRVASLDYAKGIETLKHRDALKTTESILDFSAGHCDGVDQLT